MSYLSQLSRRQTACLVITLIAAAVIVGIGWALESRQSEESSESFSTAMSIKEIAPALGVTGKALARELGLPLDAPKEKPLKKLNVKQEELDQATAHMLSHRAGYFKYFLFGAIVLWAVVYLSRLGRPDNSPARDRKKWYPQTIYVTTLLVAVIACGFWLGKSPNPMEGAVKLFKAMVGLYPSVLDKFVAFAFFIGLAVIGNKVICGWACPFGGLQELIYSLPWLKKMKRRKVPFWFSNLIRATLFLAMLLLMFGVVGNRRGFVVYHQLNPFNLFNWDIESWGIGATIVVSLTLSFGVYRPFCQFICPFGFVSWLFERFNITGVQFDHRLCDDCGACKIACPTTAVKHIVEGSTLRADCYSCSRCLNICPTEALHYGLPTKKQSSTIEIETPNK